MDKQQFKTDPRSYALAFVDEMGMDARDLFQMAVNYMSHDDVRDMLDANGMSPRFNDDDDEEDDES